MVDAILVTTLVLASVLTVMTARVLRSAIALAVTSAVLAVVMFRLGSPIAGVFELSVCAGLIPAILISVIGLTRRLGPEGLAARRLERLKRYWYLPVIVIIAGVILSQVNLRVDYIVPAVAAEGDPRTVLWNLRHLDLLGQIVVLLGGAFAVVVLLKELRNER
jgi:NADH:ubiquinone oxidoreductase subunit 6 (subunit J)